MEFLGVGEESSLSLIGGTINIHILDSQTDFGVPFTPLYVASEFVSIDKPSSYINYHQKHNISQPVGISVPAERELCPSTQIYIAFSRALNVCEGQCA